MFHRQSDMNILTWPCSHLFQSHKSFQERIKQKRVGNKWPNAKYIISVLLVQFVAINSRVVIVILCELKERILALNVKKQLAMNIL